MPTYDYQCRSCGSVTEVIHSMLEDGPTTCEQCGGALRRMVFPTGIIFKGSGFPKRLPEDLILVERRAVLEAGQLQGAWQVRQRYLGEHSLERRHGPPE